jgi:hypothetical protein
MVAYSFKRRFVAPILVGLGIDALDLARRPKAAVAVLMSDGPRLRPKRQTIREEGLKRHARPGDELQLYCGMRTQGCFLIGRARCTNAQPISIEIESPLIVLGAKPDRTLLTTRQQLDRFAQSDGFASYEEMALFWYANHHATMNDFRGVIISWEPLAVQARAA